MATINEYNFISPGFAAATILLKGENEDDFFKIHCNFLNEFAPATHMELTLIEKMVHNQWLSLRAIRLQNDAFRYRMQPRLGETPHDLGLLIRYQATSDRAFHKAHAELLKAQKERKNSEIGFVLQNAAQPAETPQTAAPQPAKKPAAKPEILPTPDYDAHEAALLAEMARHLGVTVEELTQAA